MIRAGAHVGFHPLTGLLRTSIQAKVSAVVIAAVLSAVTLTALTSAIREAERSLVSKRAELIGIGAALAASVARPLSEGKSSDAGRALTAIRNIPGVTFAQVIDSRGAVVAQLGTSIVLERKDRRVTPNAELSAFSSLFLPHYIVEQPIVSGGREIGTLRLIANISTLKNILTESLTSALMAGLLAAVLGLALAQRLQGTITEPIRRLTRTLKDVRASQSYAHTVERASDDETGLMVDAFNDMMQQIRLRDERLQRHREHLESEVESRTSDLKQATLAAQSANAAKSEFLATMSHEIRTPLNGMLVMAELLATGDLPDRQQRHADVIVSSGQSLLAIINDILDLSKIEAGRLELEMLPVEPAAIADQVMSLFSARAAAKGLDLACYVSRNVPRSIAADPVRLNQILANLVNNALKFTEKGSVVLSVEAEAVDEAARTCTIRFSITDTGIGIPPDKLAAIFDPFSQADQSTTRKFGGTGIGLSISKKLVAAMGGDIEVTSRVGEGSTFRFSITTTAIEDAPAPAAANRDRQVVLGLPPSATRACLDQTLRDMGYRTVVEEPNLIGDTPMPDRRIAIVEASVASCFPAIKGVQLLAVADVGDVNASRLVEEGRAAGLLIRPISGRDVAQMLAQTAGDVDARAASRRSQRTAMHDQFAGAEILAADDNAVNREVLSEALSRLGVRLTLVADGKAAVEAAASRAFDAIFMDCSMPVMDGYEATRMIRAAEDAAGGAHVPIIALTAHVAGAHANAWRDAGMCDTLSKPFTMKSLTACLERWLKTDAPATAAEGKEATPETSAMQREVLAPVLDTMILEDIRQMQDEDDDLVGRIISLFSYHAPPALGRLEKALADGDAQAIAETSHALKSLCRNVGARRLGDRLHQIEGDARDRHVTAPQESSGTLRAELEAALHALAQLSKAAGAHDHAA